MFYQKQKRFVLERSRTMLANDVTPEITLFFDCCFFVVGNPAALTLAGWAVSGNGTKAANQ